MVLTATLSDLWRLYLTVLGVNWLGVAEDATTTWPVLGFALWEITMGEWITVYLSCFIDADMR